MDLLQFLVFIPAAFFAFSASAAAYTCKRMLSLSGRRKSGVEKRGGDKKDSGKKARSEPQSSDEDFTKEKQFKKIDYLFKTTFFTGLSAAVLCFSAIALLGWIIVSRAEGFEAAYRYYAPDGSLFYSLTGIWASEGGALLIWVFLNSIYAIWLFLQILYHAPFIDRKKWKLTDKSSLKSAIVVLASYSSVSFISFLLTLGAAITHPFRSGSSGAGLSVQLLSPWMAVHPPVVFAGYSLLAGGALLIMFQTAIGLPESPIQGSIQRKVPSGEPSYHFSLINKSIYYSLILSFIFLTLGIGLGAIWSYQTFGWGGLWAFDPVENTSLLPWMASLAGLHLVFSGTKNTTRDIVISGISLIAITAAALVTRSGSLIAGGALLHSWEKSTTGFFVSLIGISSLGLTLLILLLKEDEKNQKREKKHGATVFSFEKKSGNASDNFFLLALPFISAALYVLTGVFAGKGTGEESFFLPGFLLISIYLLVSLSVCSVRTLWKNPTFKKNRDSLLRN
ncbi:MAG: cytochrome c biogenesis protein CcsA, partial [Thermoplasmata archaeon]